MDRSEELPLPFGAIHRFGLAFVGIALVGSNDLWSALYLLSLVLAFILGTYLYTMQPMCFAGATLAIILFLIYSLFPGLNPNVVGAVLALALAGTLAYRLWPFVPFLIAGVICTQSRTAILASTVPLFALAWQHFRATAFFLAFGAIALVAAYSDHRGLSFMNRLGIWQDTINHLSIFGSGWGSFGEAYASWPRHTSMSGEITNYAYNDYLQLLLEVGLGVLPLWIMLVLAFERSSNEAKLILATFGTLSLGFFPLYIPGLAHFAAVAFGFLCTSKPRYIPVFA